MIAIPIEMDGSAAKNSRTFKISWEGDMRRITCQHQAPKPHRLGNEAAKRGDALFQRRTGFERFGHLRRQATAEFVPEGVITPVFNLVIDITLDVIARPRHRAHRAEREAACCVGVNNLFGNRLCV